jgi:glyoxylase-like metal-dependent hydrolase (beta-lactamase superfamily II)
MTLEELTSRLETLRVRPLTLEIPFAQAGKHVHFYLVEDSRPALFDTGLHKPDSSRWLEKALRKFGYELADIQRVFLTHGHIDHYGNARVFQNLGAEVYLHPADFNKVLTVEDHQAAVLVDLYAEEFQRHGFPASLVNDLGIVLSGQNEFARPIAPPTPVADGDCFTFDRFTVRTVSVPGHTPGCVAYFLGDSGVAITGDHLLHGISPNPLFELSVTGEKFASLVTYFQSLEKILAEPLELGLPAHGMFVTDAPELVRSLTAFYERRQSKIFRMLTEPVQAFALCQSYYRRLKRFDIFLGFSEMLGNLEMMAARGEISQNLRANRYVYERMVDKPIAFPLAS